MQVQAPTPDPSAQAACRALVAALPASLGKGLGHRSVRPTSGWTAAWGTPAVVLRCGVGLPAEYRPDAAAAGVDGFDWLPTPAGDADVFTLLGRTPRLSVAVPARYQAGDVLAGLSETVRRATTPAP